MQQKPCRNGHLETRNKFGHCKGCLREATRRYKARDPEKVRQRVRRWEHENPGRVLATRKARRDRESEKINAQQRAWRARNPDRVSAALKKWRQENPEHFDRLRKEWAKNNPDKVRAIGRRTQAARRASMPKWVDKAEIKRIYENCPEGHEVDHVVPIKGKNVCGLHVPWNLQYLTVSENRRKSNQI